MINEEFIAHFVQKAAETIAPWLVFAVVVLLILWLVLLCRQTRPFAKPFAQFIGLPPFGKFIVIETPAESIRARFIKADEGWLYFDRNHELAGEDLLFEITLVDVAESGN